MVWADSVLDFLLNFNSAEPILSDLVANPNAFSFIVEPDIALLNIVTS
mgnify:CR=1 FL=1